MYRFTWESILTFTPRERLTLLSLAANMTCSWLDCALPMFQSKKTTIFLVSAVATSRILSEIASS